MIPQKLYSMQHGFWHQKKQKNHTLGRHLQGCSSSSFGDPREKRLAGEEISLVKRPATLRGVITGWWSVGFLSHLESWKPQHTHRHSWLYMVDFLISFCGLCGREWGGR